MADTDLALDEAIRSALRSAARPGDPSGIAEAIRARLDGGPGDGPDGSGGPAGGSGPTGTPFPLRWFAGGAALALAGGAVLGWSGALGRPLPSTDALAPVGTARTVSTYDCPGAVVVGTLRAGDRVLALGTHDGWAAVRDPRDTGQVVWIDADALTVDPGQVPLDSLVLAGCPQLVAAALEAEQVEPSPDASAEPDSEPAPTQQPPIQQAPDPGPDPAPPVDNPPTVGQAGASPSTIAAQGCAPETASVSVVATDDKGISSVTMTWSGGGAAMSPGGSTWSGTFGPIAGVPVEGQSFVVTIVATDTAGQTASTSVVVNVTYCLI